MVTIARSASTQAARRVGTKAWSAHGTVARARARVRQRDERVMSVYASRSKSRVSSRSSSEADVAARTWKLWPQSLQSSLPILVLLSLRSRPGARSAMSRLVTDTSRWQTRAGSYAQLAGYRPLVSAEDAAERLVCASRGGGRVSRGERGARMGDEDGGDGPRTCLIRA